MFTAFWGEQQAAVAIVTAVCIFLRAVEMLVYWGFLHIPAKRFNSEIALLKGSRFRCGFQPIRERFRPH
jgi:hypothetical protein